MQKQRCQQLALAHTSGETYPKQGSTISANNRASFVNNINAQTKIKTDNWLKFAQTQSKQCIHRTRTHTYTHARYIGAQLASAGSRHAHSDHDRWVAFGMVWMRMAMSGPFHLVRCVAHDCHMRRTCRRCRRKQTRWTKTWMICYSCEKFAGFQFAVYTNSTSAADTQRTDIPCHLISAD